MTARLCAICKPQEGGTFHYGPHKYIVDVHVGLVYEDMMLTMPKGYTELDLQRAVIAELNPDDIEVDEIEVPG